MCLTRCRSQSKLELAKAFITGSTDGFRNRERVASTVLSILRAAFHQGRDVLLKRKRQPLEAIDSRANHEVRVVDNQRPVHVDAQIHGRSLQVRDITSSMAHAAALRLRNAGERRAAHAGRSANTGAAVSGRPRGSNAHPSRLGDARLTFARRGGGTDVRQAARSCPYRRNMRQSPP